MLFPRCNSKKVVPAEQLFKLVNETRNSILACTVPYLSSFQFQISSFYQYINTTGY